MCQKVLNEKLRIFFIGFLLFVFIVIIEDLLFSHDLSGLKSITTSPISILRYTPIIISLYLFAKEIVRLLNRNVNCLLFLPKKEGIVYIQDYNVWLSIFETPTLRNIQTSELKQILHLKSFSLELDVKKICVRVYLYSKSYEELKERIKHSKPILEVVLPNVIQMSNKHIIELLDEIKLLKIGNKYVLNENSEFLFPQSCENDTKFPSTFSRMILACKIEENSHLEKCAQCYIINSNDQSSSKGKSSFFKWLDKILFNPSKIPEENFWSIKELQRVKLRFYTKSSSLSEFKKGLVLFQKGLTLISSESKEIFQEEKIIDHSFINNHPEVKAKSTIISEKTSFLTGMNQICCELCKIPSEHKLTQKEKVKKCRRIANFCKKLLTNENFSSILDNILNQQYQIEKIHLISELKQHLSYHHLICICAQLSHSNQPNLSYEEVVEMINIILKLVQKNTSGDKKAIISRLANDKTIEKLSSSLAP